MASRRAIIGLTLVSVLILSACNLNNPSDTTTGIECSPTALINAIEMANNTKEQVAINLDGGCVYEFTEAYSGDPMHELTALPPISSPIIIQGNGAVLSIEYQKETLVRLFYVSQAGDMTIHNLTMSPVANSIQHYWGFSETAGGFILNHGTLAVHEVIAEDGIATYGGAIANYNELLISNSQFLAIHTWKNINFGGAIFNFGGNAEIRDSDFSGFVANGSAGAILSEHLENGSLTIVGSTFENNEGAQGGAIKSNGPITINSCSFIENKADSGGAIYVKGNSNISGSTFMLNEASIGGGLYFDRGNLSIDSSSFIGNLAAEGGGIHIRSMGNIQTIVHSVTLRNSTFSSNRTTPAHPMESAETEEGAAIYFEGPLSETLFENITISGNEGTSALFSFGSIHLRYSTIAHNQSAGIKSEHVHGITLEDTIIAMNDQDCVNDYGFVASGSVLDSDGSCPGAIISVDPMLEPLADNGGSTMTHALPANSPAVDAATGDCPATDQRGEARPGGSDCDLGAYEFGVTAMGDAAIGDIPELDLPDGPLDPPPDLSFCIARVETLVPCNEGPGNDYPTVNSLRPEGVVEVTGQSINGDYAVIRNPCFPELGCWVKKSTLIFYCDDGELPLASTPALEQPEPDRSLGGPTCNPGASNDADCVASGGTWVGGASEAGSCQCN